MAKKWFYNSADANTISTGIHAVLAKHDGYCMDVPEEVQALADALQHFLELGEVILVHPRKGGK
jgi:hypothetical protein